MPELQWPELLLALALASDPTDVLDRVAETGQAPPEGEVTRGLLAHWLRTTRRLRGGLFKTGDHGGFRMYGSFDEPFLSVVLGHGERKGRVLQDLERNDPATHAQVLRKLEDTAAHARQVLPTIKNFGAPVEGKMMLRAVCLYASSLVDDPEPTVPAPSPHEGMQVTPTIDTAADNGQPEDGSAAATDEPEPDEDDTYVDSEVDPDVDPLDLADPPEPCPCCGQRNAWGRAEHCEHYIDSIFDTGAEGDVKKLLNAWTHLVHAKAERAPTVLRALAGLVGVRKESVDYFLRTARDWHEDMGDEGLAHELAGPMRLGIGNMVIQTQGMASGHGYSIYCEDAKWFTGMAEDLAKLAHALPWE